MRLLDRHPGILRRDILQDSGCGMEGEGRRKIVRKKLLAKCHHCDGRLKNTTQYILETRPPCLGSAARGPDGRGRDVLLLSIIEERMIANDDSWKAAQEKCVCALSSPKTYARIPVAPGQGYEKDAMEFYSVGVRHNSVDLPQVSVANRRRARSARSRLAGSAAPAAVTAPPPLPRIVFCRRSSARMCRFVASRLIIDIPPLYWQSFRCTIFINVRL
ncbi:hypothetical protein EVAR_30449_1 [Eumeta japonica]|uniref:Uncharacterized protein n=1 Tax=Eumeta variegata TaxID=151549 RepID=A0A4C1VYU6_EUMVA|nr:hypothetical protein EVAR_30449_1 [Eumeta japonica]